MSVKPEEYSELLIRAYHNVLQLEETKRACSRTTTSFRGRNAMDYIYKASPDGKGSRTVSEIAGFLKITRPSCTSLIEKLEDLGYVQKNVNAEDERSRSVSLTRKGRLITTYQTKHTTDMIYKIMNEFTDDEKLVLIKGFKRLNEVFEDCTEVLRAGKKENKR